MLSWVGSYISMRNAVFKRLQTEPDSVYSCCSGRNYSLSTRLKLLLRRSTCRAGWEVPSAKTSKVSSGGLKWGKEVSYQQLSQQMWASTPQPQGRLEKWSLLLHYWVCVFLFIAKRPQFAPSSLRFFQNPSLKTNILLFPKKDWK